MNPVYDSGFPVSEKLVENLDALKDRIYKKKASLLIIDGGVGEGKTTLADHCAAIYQRDSTGLKYIDLKEQYSMGGEQFQERLQICSEKKRAVIIYDEAGDFDRRGALTSFNKRLNRVFQTYRAFKILVILVLPCFKVLDESLFDLKIPRLLLNCCGRSQKQGNFRAYSLYRMQYIKHKMMKLVVKEYAYTQVTPNFRGHYLNVGPEREKELDKIGMDGKLNIVNDNILSSRGLISIQAIGPKLSRSTVWVRKKLKELRLEPAQTHKKKKYYDKDVMKILAQHIK